MKIHKRKKNQDELSKYTILFSLSNQAGNLL